MKMHMLNGTVREESYEEVCENLGFIAEVHFVKITTRGTITFTCGKPEEIRALRQACRENGYKMAKSLSEE